MGKVRGDVGRGEGEVGKCDRVWGKGVRKCWGRCGRSVGGGVGKCVRVWGSVLGSGEVLGEVWSGEVLGEV